MILRKERPHPGAQLTFTDVDGMRVTAFLTDTTAWVVPAQVAGLELRQRQHARVEDRIREATELRKFPCHAVEENNAWLQVVLTATDLIAWTCCPSFILQMTPSLRMPTRNRGLVALVTECSAE